MDQPLKPPKQAPYERSPTKPRSGGRVVVASLVVLLLVAGIVWWTRHQAVPEQQAGPGRGGGRFGGAPMSIVPETVGKGDIGIKLNALGTVTSLATVTIRTQISGYLIKVAVQGRRRGQEGRSARRDRFAAL